MKRLIDDNIFENKITYMKIEFITYEPFYDFHSHVSMRINFDMEGSISTFLLVNSVRLDNF